MWVTQIAVHIFIKSRASYLCTIFLSGDLWLQKSDHRGSGQIFRQIIVRFWRTVTTPPLTILDGTGQCAVSIHGQRPLTTAAGRGRDQCLVPMQEATPSLIAIQHFKSIPKTSICL